MSGFASRAPRTMSSEMSTPMHSSKCCASACVIRPSPQPKSSARSRSFGTPSSAARHMNASASAAPVAKNSSLSQRPKRLPGLVSDRPVRIELRQLVPVLCLAFNLHENRPP